MRYERIICYLVSVTSFVFADFFSNSTLYISGTMGTPYINGNQVLKDDYNYTIGLRKIALFPYQSRSRFYKGSESSLSDKAVIGAVNGWEYLFKYSQVRNRDNEFKDAEVWLKWSNDKYVMKGKYTNKESRDLEFAELDFRYRKHFWFIDFTTGFTIKGHPVYGHPAIEDYDGFWWELAYEYGYEDNLVPVTDLNDNGEIDSYYLWIETDPDTEDGYWTYYYEEADYYWTDPDSNAVAYSDAEFYEYHLPSIVEQYNEDNKIKEYQAELYQVIGLDIMIGSRDTQFYSHIWINVFPKSYGLTDKSYEGKENQYDVGVMFGTDIGEHIGLFIQGTKVSFYGRDEKYVSTGINWRF